MSAGDIYCKSKLGVEELTSRTKKLPSRMRTMLILIDGQAPMLVLQEEAKRLGVGSDFLDQLQSLGLIVKTNAPSKQRAGFTEERSDMSAQMDDEFSKFRRAQDFMNSSVVNALGIKSFLFAMKLERASSIAELRKLVEPYKAAIEKGGGQAEAEVLSLRLLGMLA